MQCQITGFKHRIRFFKSVFDGCGSLWLWCNLWRHYCGSIETETILALANPDEPQIAMLKQRLANMEYLLEIPRKHLSKTQFALSFFLTGPAVSAF